MSVDAIWRRVRIAFAVARARALPSPVRIAAVAKRLQARGRFQEADTLLLFGLRKAPDDFGLLEQFALSAHRSGRYLEALERWKKVSCDFPDVPMAWCGVACNARELGRKREASAAIDYAVDRFPDDVVVLSEAARVRDVCGDYDAAAKLWRQILSHPAADATWYIALAANLMQLHRYDEVFQVLNDLADKKEAQPSPRAAACHWGMASDHAAQGVREELVRHCNEAVARFGDQAFAMRQVAETTPDLDAARAALRRMIEVDPRDVEAHESYVRVLLRCDDIETAGLHLDTASKIAPDHSPFQLLRGSVAIRKQDWDAACAIAAKVAARDADDLAATRMLERISYVRNLDEPAQKDRDRPAPIAPPMRDEPATRKLLLGFESIGQDCEFGTVQRAYGAEPLGLLRWTDTNVASLLAALADGFSGMGEPEHTELTIGSFGEILVRDRRWHLAMHTFLYESEVNISELYSKLCRRIVYLRDKLVRELQTGEKIFVFNSDREPMDDVDALHSAILRWGPNQLLNVRHMAGGGGAPPGKPGTIIKVKPTLFVGYLSRNSNLQDIAYDDWVSVCQRCSDRRYTTTEIALPAAPGCHQGAG